MVSRIGVRSEGCELVRKPLSLLRTVTRGEGGRDIVEEGREWMYVRSDRARGVCGVDRYR